MKFIIDFNNIYKLIIIILYFVIYEWIMLSDFDLI